MPEVEDRYEFANGWTIVVDYANDGQVYFLRFPPGVLRPITDATRIGMPVADFLAAVKAQREAEAVHA